MSAPSTSEGLPERVRIWAALVIVGAFAAVGTIALLGSETDAGVGDPSARLQCPSDSQLISTVTYAGETAETASPEQIADRWATGTVEEHAQAGLSLDVATQNLTQRSASKVDIAYSNTSGDTVAVMSLIKDPRLGWRIESIVECAEGVER